MPLTPDLPKVEIAIVEMTNVFRKEQALGSVKPEPTLTRTAREYARFLAAATVFSHEADGRRPADRIKAAGYAACGSAENLAWMLDSRGFETRDLALRMVEGWKGSPPHRKNLLMTGATETGVAIAKVTGAEKYMAVQLLARPQSLQYGFRIENGSGRAVGYTLGGKAEDLPANGVVRYTLCEAATLTFGGVRACGDPLRDEVRPSLQAQPRRRRWDQGRGRRQVGGGDPGRTLKPPRRQACPHATAAAG